MEPGLSVSHIMQVPTGGQMPTADGRVQMYPCYAFEFHLVLMTIDPDLGKPEIKRYVVGHDCGTVINPKIVRGMTMGGIAHGIGAALYEEFAYNDDGLLVAQNFMDYLLPSSHEIPPVEIVHHVTPSPHTVFGQKGSGESGYLGAPAAIASAINDAVQAAGHRGQQPAHQDRPAGRHDRRRPRWQCRRRRLTRSIRERQEVSDDPQGGDHDQAISSGGRARRVRDCIALPASAAEFTMKFGTATFNDTQHQYIKFYKEALEKASNGRIEVGIYPRSELGPIPRMIDGLQLGTVEAFIAPTDFYVGVDPRFGVYSTPMLFKDKDHATRDGVRSVVQRIRADAGRAQGHSRASASSAPARRTTRPRTRSCGCPTSPARSCASTPPRWSARRCAGSAPPPCRCRSTR